jgi:hypothetical protein
MIGPRLCLAVALALPASICGPSKLEQCQADLLEQQGEVSLLKAKLEARDAQLERSARAWPTFGANWTWP